jgi:hypothetical protein
MQSVGLHPSYEKYFRVSNDQAFNRLHQPDAIAPHPGIYRCEDCGYEIVLNAGHRLPSENHRQHIPPDAIAVDEIKSRQFGCHGKGWAGVSLATVSRVLNNTQYISEERLGATQIHVVIWGE